LRQVRYGKQERTWRYIIILVIAKQQSELDSIQNWPSSNGYMDGEKKENIGDRDRKSEGKEKPVGQCD